MSDKEKARVRKSLTALKGTDQRKSYFYCLKLLGVLPPPPGSGFEDWKFKSPAYFYLSSQKYYTPKCLHDLLISSHATTCEHFNFYFSSYHRNMMILTELFLNFAHQVLRQGFKKLERVYPSPKFDWLYGQGKRRQAWQHVFDAYQKFKDVPDLIANHYWNPTDYLSDDDLQLPIEITKNDDKNDPINVLFQQINGEGSFPWNINVPRRWFNDVSEYQQSKSAFLNLTNFFQNKDIEINQRYKDFIQGKLNPRNYPSIYGQDTFYLNKWDAENRGHLLFLNKEGFNDNYEISGPFANESLARCGARSKNTQYITNSECENNPLLKNIQANYNMHFPHYQYANALFNQEGIEVFLDGSSHGIQKSHNSMHDLFRMMMQDNSYSPTSLVFFPFHSWIDVQYQIYIRRANASKDIKKPFNKLSDILNGYKKASEQTADDSNIFKIQNWQISGDKLDKQKAGFYLVFEYVSQDKKLISAAFNTRDYLITREKIRTSYQFNEMYRKYYIGDLNKDRFYFLNDAANFNFDYDYQIGHNIKEVLNADGTNIPKYLEDMKVDIKFLKKKKQQAIKGLANNSRSAKNAEGNETESLNLPITEEFKQVPFKEEKIQLMGATIMEFQIDVPPIQQVFLEDPDNQEELLLNKLFKNGILIFASYPPNTENGSNYITIKAQNILIGLNRYAKQHNIEIDRLIQLQQLETFLRDGLLVDDIFIFGKQQAAKHCPNCKTNKVRYEDVDQNLRHRVPKLWKHLHLQTLNRILYDSEYKDLKPSCIYQKLSLVPNQKFLDYRFVAGAEEIEVEVVNNVRTRGSQFIRIEAESYSIEHNTIAIIPTKKFYTFTAKFDFYKLFDVHNNGKKEHFDRYVYKVLKGGVTLGTVSGIKRTGFSLRIPCFQRLLRVRIEISYENEKLRVLIADADYDVKVEYYERASRE